MATRMLQRRGTAAEWAALNPILADGEIGFETDTKVIKLGDGETAWNDLSLSAITAAGTVMTGPLVVLEPVEPDEAVRLVDVTTLVNNAVSEVVIGDPARLKLTVGDTEPIDPEIGDLWIDTDSS